MLYPQFEQQHYITVRFQTSKLPIGEMELSFLGPNDYSRAQDILRLIDPTAFLLQMSWLTLQEYHHREAKRPTEPPAEKTPAEKVESVDQVYEVIQTTHASQNARYLHILVDGKRVGVPPQFNAMPGDQIIFRPVVPRSVDVSVVVLAENENPPTYDPTRRKKESSELKETANAETGKS